MYSDMASQNFPWLLPEPLSSQPMNTLCDTGNGKIFQKGGLWDQQPQRVGMGGRSPPPTISTEANRIYCISKARVALVINIVS